MKIVNVILIYMFLYSHLVLASNTANSNQDLWQIFLSVRDHIRDMKPHNFDRSRVDRGFWHFFTDINNSNAHIDDKGMKKFLSKLMHEKSQRENWYEVTPYIAEFYCTASSVPIILAGCGENMSWYTIFAGMMSVLSHTMPTQWAHDLDMLGVIVIGLVVFYNLPAVISSPYALCHGLFAIVINSIDTTLSRKYGRNLGPWLHVLWHALAANALSNLQYAIVNCVPGRCNIGEYYY